MWCGVDWEIARSTRIGQRGKTSKAANRRDGEEERRLRLTCSDQSHLAFIFIFIFIPKSWEMEIRMLCCVVLCCVVY